MRIQVEPVLFKSVYNILLFFPHVIITCMTIKLMETL